MDELIRDLCSVEFRTKSKTRELITAYTKKIREETIKECIYTIISKRGCRSHEPENCNVCAGRDEAIKSLNKLKK